MNAMTVLLNKGTSNDAVLACMYVDFLLFMSLLFLLFPFENEANKQYLNIRGPSAVVV